MPVPLAPDIPVWWEIRRCTTTTLAHSTTHTLPRVQGLPHACPQQPWSAGWRPSLSAALNTIRTYSVLDVPQCVTGFDVSRAKAAHHDHTQTCICWHAWQCLISPHVAFDMKPCAESSNLSGPPLRSRSVWPTLALWKPHTSKSLLVKLFISTRKTSPTSYERRPSRKPLHDELHAPRRHLRSRRRSRLQAAPAPPSGKGRVLLYSIHVSLVFSPEPTPNRHAPHRPPPPPRRATSERPTLRKILLQRGRGSRAQAKTNRIELARNARRAAPNVMNDEAP